MMVSTFFGLEVELWKIGDSPAAPKFNVIAKPNAWSQSVAQAMRAIEEAELSDLRLLQQEYWAAFLDTLNQINGPVVSNKKPQPQHYMNFPIGRTKVRLNTAMIRPKSQIRLAINLCGAKAKLYFQLLQAQRRDIERDFGHPLEWHEMPGGQESRIAYCLNEVDVENRADWSRQHHWLVEQANAFYQVFAPRVCTLDIDINAV